MSNMMHKLTNSLSLIEEQKAIFAAKQAKKLNKKGKKE